MNDTRLSSTSFKRVRSGPLDDLTQKRARSASGANVPSLQRNQSTLPVASSTATSSSQNVANQMFRHALSAIDTNTLRPDSTDLRKEAQSLFRLDQQDRNPHWPEDDENDELNSNSDDLDDVGLDLEARREALAIQLQLASTLFLVFKQPDLPGWGQLNSKCNPIGQAGRHYARTVCAFGPFEPVFAMGRFAMVNLARRNVELEVQEHELPFYQKWTALEACFKRDKDLLHWVAVGGLQAVQSAIANARNNARSVDAHLIAVHLSKLTTWMPSLDGSAKPGWGFHHTATRKLLVPFEDVEKIKDPNVLEQWQNGKRLHPDMFPPFLYKDYTRHQNRWKGFLRSDLLLAAAKLVFLGPAAVDTTSSKKKSANGKSKAHSNGMTGMSLAAIVYVATCTYFSLTSDDRFTTIGTTVSYRLFYVRLLDLLNKQPQLRRNLLLEWWNTNLFAPQDEIPALQVGETTSRAEMEAQSNEQVDDDE